MLIKVELEDSEAIRADYSDCTKLPGGRAGEGAAVSYVLVVDISADPDAVGAELDEICRAAGSSR